MATAPLIHIQHLRNALTDANKNAWTSVNYYVTPLKKMPARTYATTTQSA